MTKILQWMTMLSSETGQEDVNEQPGTVALVKGAPHEAIKLVRSRTGTSWC